MSDDSSRPADPSATSPSDEAGTKEAWEKPEMVSFQPVSAARGISYRIGDGVSNLS